MDPCQALGRCFDARPSPWAAAAISRRLLTTMRHDGALHGDASSSSQQQQQQAEDEDEENQVISITWALASSPGPSRRDSASSVPGEADDDEAPPPPQPQPQPQDFGRGLPPAMASPVLPQTQQERQEQPPPPAAVDAYSDLDLDFFAGGGGGVSGSSGEEQTDRQGTSATTAGGSALSRAFESLGLTDHDNAEAAPADERGPTAKGPPPAVAVQLRPTRGPLSAEAEAAIADMPDLGFLLSKVPFLPHQHLHRKGTQVQEQGQGLQQQEREEDETTAGSIIDV